MQNYEKKKVMVVVLAKGPNESLFLLQLQTNLKRGGFWQNVTGSVEEGESFFDAALRELSEECKNLRPDYLFEVDFEQTFIDRNSKKVLEKTFAVVLGECQEVELSAEHQAYLWKNVKAVEQTDYLHPSNYDGFIKTLEHICQRELG